MQLYSIRSQLKLSDPGAILPKVTLQMRAKIADFTLKNLMFPFYEVSGDTSSECPGTHIYRPYPWE